MVPVRSDRVPAPDDCHLFTFKACQERLLPRGAGSSSAFLVIQDFPDNEGFRMAPGLIVVAAEGDEAIEYDIAGFHLNNVEFRPLHQRAELVKAADQEIGGVGRLRLVEQLIRIDVANRTGIWRTIEDRRFGPFRSPPNRCATRLRIRAGAGNDRRFDRLPRPRYRYTGFRRPPAPAARLAPGLTEPRWRRKRRRQAG